MTLINFLTGEEFDDDDDAYLRSMKQDDSYHFSYPFEYITERFGDGEDDIKLDIATVNVSLSWDDSTVPGYVVSYTVDSPTPIPNEWTGNADELFFALWFEITADVEGCDISSELYKDWPIP